jgi:hypothetical protein
VREVPELLGAGDKVGFAVDLHHHAHPAAAVAVEFDHAVLGDAVGPLGRGRQTILAQDGDGLVHIAAGLFQRLPAIQDSGSGGFTQFFDEGSRDFHGFISPPPGLRPVLDPQRL